MTWRSSQARCWYRTIYGSFCPGTCYFSAFARGSHFAAVFQLLLCVYQSNFDVLKTHFCAPTRLSRILLYPSCDHLASCDHPALCAHPPAPAFSWLHLQRCDPTFSAPKHSQEIPHFFIKNSFFRIQYNAISPAMRSGMTNDYGTAFPTDSWILAPGSCSLIWWQETPEPVDEHGDQEQEVSRDHARPEQVNLPW